MSELLTALKRCYGSITDGTPAPVESRVEFMLTMLLNGELDAANGVLANVMLLTNGVAPVVAEGIVLFCRTGSASVFDRFTAMHTFFEMLEREPDEQRQAYHWYGCKKMFGKKPARELLPRLVAVGGYAYRTRRETKRA